MKLLADKEPIVAMIQCPECSKRISDKAPACPSCGYPLQQQLQAEALAKTLTSGSSWLIQSWTLTAGHAMLARFEPNGSLAYKWGPQPALGMLPVQQGRWNSTGNLLFLDVMQFLDGQPFETKLTVEIHKIESQQMTGIDKWSREWFFAKA